VVGRARFEFFGLLKSESGWVASLNHQPVVGRTGSGRVTCFDSSSFRAVVSWCWCSDLAMVAQCCSGRAVLQWWSRSVVVVVTRCCGGGCVVVCLLYYVQGGSHVFVPQT